MTTKGVLNIIQFVLTRVSVIKRVKLFIYFFCFQEAIVVLCRVRILKDKPRVGVGGEKELFTLFFGEDQDCVHRRRDSKRGSPRKPDPEPRREPSRENFIEQYLFLTARSRPRPSPDQD